MMKMSDNTYMKPRLSAHASTRLAVRCAEQGCPDYQWNIKNVPQSIYCWKHSEAHGEEPTKRYVGVTHG